MKIAPLYKFQNNTFLKLFRTGFKGKTAEELKQEKQTLYDAADRISKMSEDDIARQEQSVKDTCQNFFRYMTQIREAKNRLEGFQKNNQAQKFDAAEAYFDGVKNLAKNNKGFNRISGYEDIKKQLEDSFILKTMLREKMSENIEIPNAFLFFGPTGCGKTTFALALAEQSLCNIEIISAGLKQPEEIMQEVLNKAQAAKNNYELSEDKKRTIILIDEFDTISYESSPILEQLRSFIKTCAKDYKCTLFLTTNYPLDIDQSILSNDIIPDKIPVPAASVEDAKKIIEDYLAKKNKFIVATENILEELFKNKSLYSNKDIIDILDLTLLRYQYPEESEYIAEIKRGRVSPLLTPALISKFEEEKAKLGLG